MRDSNAELEKKLKKISLKIIAQAQETIQKSYDENNKKLVILKTLQYNA